MSGEPPRITSLSNPRIKQVVKLRQRSHRDDLGLMIVEGYRELKRAVDNRHNPVSLFVCPPLFLGHNEQELVDRCRDAGAEVWDCAAPVFEKIAYRERPEGLLAVAPQVRGGLSSLRLGPAPCVVVAEAIEKPGNLGTIIRSAEGAGADGVVVCDRCTDINNPNVVRASIGTLFCLPVVEAPSAEAFSWLRERGIRVLVTSPHAETIYTGVNLREPVAIIVGAEQYGASSLWMEQADVRVRIPMMGQGDSLNVASAATIVIYETMRQRGFASGRPV